MLEMLEADVIEQRMAEATFCNLLFRSSRYYFIILPVKMIYGGGDI